MQTDPQLSAVVDRIMEVRAEAMKLRPVNRALYTPKPESELSKDESWKGESKLRSVKRFNYSGRNMKTDKVHQRIANLTQRRAKVPVIASIEAGLCSVLRSVGTEKRGTSARQGPL